MPEPRTVLVTDAEYPDLDLERERLQAAGGRLVLGNCRDEAEAARAAQHYGAEAALVQYATVGERVFRACPDLRCVSRYGVGVDSIDLEAAARHGVWVANVPDYGAEEVALHAMALVLDGVRRVSALDRDVRAGGWHYLAAGPAPRLSELTLGLLGLGRIGQVLATRMAPLVARVVAFDPMLPDERWPRAVECRGSPAAAAADSRILSLHLPLTPETRSLVDTSLLDALGPAGYLVNTARGGLIDPAAVLAALDDGRLAGAGLDVLPEEPPRAEEPLRRHPRATLTPHCAWYSERSEQDMRSQAADNVIHWLHHGRPPAARTVAGPATVEAPS